MLALEGMCAALNGDRVGGLRLLRKAQDMRTPDRGIDHHQRQALRWTARLHRMLGDDAAARALLNEQTEMMTEATLDHLRTAAVAIGIVRVSARIGTGNRSLLQVRLGL